MKKHLLHFTLILCIGLLPAATFAQEAPGTSGGEEYSEEEASGSDGGSTTIIYSLPPASVKSVKRNNGNGTTASGMAEARLQVTNSTSDYILTAITSLDFVVKYQTMSKNGSWERGFISYPLESNKMPAKKLLFHFKCVSTGKVFCIPETN